MQNSNLELAKSIQFSLQNTIHGSNNSENLATDLGISNYLPQVGTCVSICILPVFLRR